MFGAQYDSCAMLISGGQFRVSTVVAVWRQAICKHHDVVGRTVYFRSPWTQLTWWRHLMETFSALLALCAGNSPVPVNSPHKGQWRGALMFSLIYAWINDWVNNREAGDLRRQRGHYDVIVMNAMHPNQLYNSMSVVLAMAASLYAVVWRATILRGRHISEYGTGEQ